MKTNKSYAKRVKVTGKGKLLVRKPGVNHFNAKKSRSKQLDQHKKNNLILNAKKLSRFLPN